MNRANTLSLGSWVLVSIGVAVAGWIFPMAGPHDWSKQCTVISAGIAATLVSLVPDYGEGTASLRLWGAASLVSGAVAVVLMLRLDDHSLPTMAIFYGGLGLVATGAIANLYVVAHAATVDCRRSVRQVIGTLGTVFGFVAGLMLGAL